MSYKATHTHIHAHTTHVISQTATMVGQIENKWSKYFDDGVVGGRVAPMSTGRTYDYGP